jgi:Trk-type K+ transport system membrane component
MEKPVCGSDKDGAEYDFPLHVAAVFIVFFASIGGCGFPVVAKKVRWMKIPPKIFFFCKHFGTGVLIATAFVHVSTALFVCYAHRTDIYSFFQLPSHPSTTHVCQSFSPTSTPPCLV